MRNIRLYLEYFGYRWIEQLICWLPDQAIYPLANFFAWLAFRVLKIRRKVSLQNLKIAFPEADNLWRERVVHQSYRHFTAMILEFMKMATWDITRIQGMIEVANPDVLQRYFLSPEGVILASGHFGNWEVAIGFLTHLRGGTSYVIQQRQKNRRIDRRMADTRRRWGIHIIYSRGAIRPALRALQKNHLLALLADQDGGPRGVFAPFFGRMASTPPGPAVLHLKSGKPLIFGFCRRKARLKFAIHLHPVQVDVSEEDTRDRQLTKITEAFNQALEAAVREHPEQYFWMHKRWKTPYPGNPPTGKSS